MNDYMLLIEGDGSNKSPEQMQKSLEGYIGWMEKWKSKGQYIEGNPFKTEGNYITQNNPVQSSGEFLNPKTTIGGFIWVKAEDIDGATKIAQECPLIDGCGIFVRPFHKM